MSTSQVEICSFCYLFLKLDRQHEITEGDELIMKQHLKLTHGVKPYEIER